MWIRISKIIEWMAGMFMFRCTQCHCLYGYAGTAKERRSDKFRRTRIADICVICYQWQQVLDDEARFYKSSMERIGALESAARDVVEYYADIENEQVEALAEVLDPPPPMSDADKRQ